MALYAGSSTSNYGLRTSSLINHNSTYTWMGWVTLVSDTNNYGHIYALLGDSTDTYVNADYIGIGGDGTTLNVSTVKSGTIDERTAASLTVGTPTHLALVRESTTALKLYVNGVQSGATATGTVSGRSSTAREQLGLLYVSYNGPIRVAGMKQWSVALTAAEIVQEMRTIVPQKLASLHAWWPATANTVADALKDYSGNGRDWTQQGTLSIVQDHPVSWGGGVLLVGKAAAGGPATITGTGALQSDAATIAGTAERTHTATGALAAQAATIAGTAERAVTGTGALSAAASTVAGAAERTVTGTGALSSAAATVEGTAERAVTGTGALAAAAATIAGTAEREVTATGALAAGAATVEGTAKRSVTGTGALASQHATIAGTGAVGDVIVGSGALEAQAATVAGTAERSVTGTGALAAQAASIAGTAERCVTGTGALTSADATVAGTGAVGNAIAGTGALVAQAASIAGTAERAVTGTGALSAQAAVVAGTAKRTIIGAGAIQAGVATINGIAIKTSTITGTGALVSGEATISGSELALDAPAAHTIVGITRVRSHAGAARVRSFMRLN